MAAALPISVLLRAPRAALRPGAADDATVDDLSACVDPKTRGVCRLAAPRTLSERAVLSDSVIGEEVGPQAGFVSRDGGRRRPVVC